MPLAENSEWKRSWEAWVVHMKELRVLKDMMEE